MAKIHFGVSSGDDLMINCRPNKVYHVNRVKATGDPQLVTCITCLSMHKARMKDLMDEASVAYGKYSGRYKVAGRLLAARQATQNMKKVEDPNG